MLKDAFGLNVTTESPTVILTVNYFIQQALSYGNQALFYLDQGLVADPQCALLHAYKAAHYLAQEEVRFYGQALYHLQIARKHVGQVTDRENWTIAAIAAWASGDVQQAIAWYRQIIAQYPQDLWAVQQAQYHYFYRGDAKQLLQVAMQALPANSDNHYLYGMVAFGLEQCHQLPDAEGFARQAIALNRNDPWAHHVIAHVLEAQGRIHEGIDWMECHADTWEQCNSLLYTHNWWHIALFYLAKRDFQRVLQLYDLHVWGRANKESSKDQVGAISTLIRLDLQGVDVESRWQDLGNYLMPRLHEHSLPFQDLHYAYALARMGRSDQLTEMLHSMQCYVQHIHPGGRSTWVEVAIPAARGLVAHAMGCWSEAIARLNPVLPRLHEVGGSHTQRQVFHQLYWHAMKESQNEPKIIAFPTDAASRSHSDASKPIDSTPDSVGTPNGALLDGDRDIHQSASAAAKLTAYRSILQRGQHLGC